MGGVANRCQTIALLSGICATYRCGLYVVWKPTTACPAAFEDVIEFDASSEVYSAIPFIRVFDRDNESSYKAAAHNKTWC